MLRIWPFSRGSASATVYSVFEPPENDGPALERAERLAFVADTFSWRAAFFGPFYLLLRREWVGLALYVAIAVTVYNLLGMWNVEGHWITWAIVLLNVVTGFEASEIERSSRIRGGWRELGTVSGATPEEAERRFFAAWLPTLSIPDVAAPVTLSPAVPAASASAAAQRHDAVSRPGSLVERLASRLIRKSASET